MKFTEILEELRKGKKVTREKWEECKTECYKCIKLEHGEIIAYLKDDNVEDKVEERTKCMFELVDFTAEDWKIYEETNKKWQPKEGKTYYLILTHGSVNYTIYDSDSRDDNERLSFGNCFKTREEAEHMAKKIKLINQLQELSNIKFSENKGKYFIYYNFRENRVLCTETNYVKIIPFEVCFKTREDCQKAIDTIGEDNLKKYYFDVED